MDQENGGGVYIPVETIQGMGGVEKGSGGGEFKYDIFDTL
jgi:hypothetical protein